MSSTALSPEHFSTDLTVNGLSLSLRPLIAERLDAIVALEARCHSHPWGLKLFADCLGGRQLCLLLESSGEVVGYFVVTCVAGEAELLNITVAPEYQGRGLGSQLLQHMLSVLDDLADTVYLEVRGSNAPAIALYDKMGFVEVGVRPNYYPTARGWEDAVIYACPLSC